MWGLPGVGAGVGVVREFRGHGERGREEAGTEGGRALLCLCEKAGRVEK